MRFSARWPGAAIVAFAILLSPKLAIAGTVLQDAWNVVSDPIGLQRSSGELSDSLQRTLIQLSSMESATNEHVAERLEQIRSILKDVIGGTDETIEKARKAMQDIESKVNLDAYNMIYSVKCVTDVTFKSTIQESFAGIISSLAKADPSLKFLGLTIVNLQTNEVKIYDPDQAYISTKRNAEIKLIQSVDDNSKAYDILSYYQNMEQSARYVECYYKDTTLGMVYAREANELELLSIP
jgi:hypothetical protein